MVKEIIKNARDPVKNRIIPQAIMEKYVKKCKALAMQVKTVEEEEQAEREIASLENKANRMENQLENGPGGPMERKYNLASKTSKLEAEAQKKNQKKKGKKTPNFEDDEEKNMFREGQFITRESKRSRKLKKIRTVHDDDEIKGKKRKAKANEDNIFNVGAKNVKRLRHEGSTAARENNALKRGGGRGGGRGGRGGGGRGGKRGRGK